MSADLSTELILKGKKDELLEMLKAIQAFEVDRLEQYRRNHDCGYIESVTVSASSESHILEKMTEDDMKEFTSRVRKIVVSASGPWGIFSTPGEVGFFEAIAEVVPQASFVGSMSGFMTGVDVGHWAELKKGKLYLSDYIVSNEVFPDLYYREVTKKLPHTKFCELFQLDPEEFDSEWYCSFLVEASEEGFPEEMDYDTFLYHCDGTEIDEDDYEDAIEKVVALDFVDYETFLESIDEEEYTERQIYDPVAKTYQAVVKANRTDN